MARGDSCWRSAMRQRHLILAALVVVPATFLAGCATDGYGGRYGQNAYGYGSGYGYSSLGYGYSSPYRSYGYGYPSYSYRYGYPSYGYRYGYPYGYGFGSYGGYYGSPYYGSGFSIIIGGRNHRGYSRGYHHRGRRGH